MREKCLALEDKTCLLVPVKCACEKSSLRASLKVTYMHFEKLKDADVCHVQTSENGPNYANQE